MSIRPLSLCVLAAMVLAAAPARSQSLLERTPNLSGEWLGPTGTIHFNFLHRFTQTGPPERDVISSPTFFLGGAVTSWALLGVHYATRSELVPRFPNEWEVLARVAPWSEPSALGRVGAQLGYNLAAESVDGEVSLARKVGPLRLIGAARGFSNALREDDPRFAAAAGAALRFELGSVPLALTGDVARFVDLEDDERVAWGAGLHLLIPYTPHTLSLQATNTATGTLQGATVGGATVRYGFEFTVPFTIARYFRPREPEPAVVARGDSVVVVEIRNLKYLPERLEIAAGTIVEWRNADPLAHTVTADDGGFDSGLFDPGETWRYRFDAAGEYPYHCIPHPFMTAVVVVR